MKAVWLTAAAALAFVMQTKISFFGVSPDLTAAVAYYIGIKGGAAKGIIFGSLIGLVEDSISGNLLGPNLLGKGIVGFSSSFNSGSLLRWTPLLGAISIFTLTVLDGFVILSSRGIFGSAPTSVSAGAFVLFIQGLINLPFGIFVKPENVE